MASLEFEEFREECRQRVNPLMDRGEMKEFADYVANRQYILDDYIQTFFEDMYQNFREDCGYETTE